MCQRGVALEKTADWKNCLVDPSRADKFCVEKKYPVLFPDPTYEKPENFIMTNCSHNDVVGLTNRYFKEAKNTFVANVSLIENILDELVSLLRPHFNGPISLSKFLEDKKGRMAGRYHSAALDVHRNGFDAVKHSRVSAFIKNELYGEMKPPRMIMGRDPRYNLLYGCYTTPLEHAMTQLPQISKGRNFLERGKQFFDCVFGSWILEGDFSKYESTQRYELLRLVELGIWNRLLDEHHFRVVWKLFQIKMVKRGHTTNGTKFYFEQCRGSGDMDTGLFNSLLTWVSCRYFEIVNGYGKGNFICDGDDNLMKIPVGSQPKNTFSEFGFDAKLVVRTDYHDADYCSGKFIQFAKGQFVYVQNINKMMQSLPVFRKTKFEHCKGVYYHSLGYMYAQLYCGMPFFRDIAHFLCSFSRHKRYVSTEMLNEINPSHTEAFQRSHDLKMEFDEDLVLIELCMAFGHSLESLSSISRFFRTSTIILDDAEDKKYNATKPPAVKISPAEADVVQQLMVATVLNQQLPPEYHHFGPI